MTRQAEIRILSVDDHRLYREGIAAVVRNQPDMRLVAEAASAQEASERFREHQPDVTLMDLRLLDASGMDAMIAILGHFPEARVILVSTYEDDLQTRSAAQAGAWGHILKTMHPREIVHVIREVHAGTKTFLPPRPARAPQQLVHKRRTFRAAEFSSKIASGDWNRNIGRQLNISDDVSTYLKQFI